MADTPQTLALLALGQQIRGEIVTQINRRSALLRMLKMAPGAGQNIAWAVEADGHLAATFADGASPADFGSDALATATLSWARYWSPFHVTGTARRAARSAQAGPGGITDLISRNMVNSAAKLASFINDDLFDGAGTTNIIAGLDVAIGDTTNTYAGINRSTVGNEYWRPTVSDPGSLTALTFAQMRADMGDIYDACGENPDIIVASTDVYNTIGNLFGDNRRYVQQVETARGMVVLNAGFEGLLFDGAVVVKDKDATANQIYYLNSNHVELVYQPLDPEAMGTVGVSFSGSDGFGVTPLGMRCDKLAKNGDADRYITFTECQLVVRRPNSCGVRKNVATT